MESSSPANPKAGGSSCINVLGARVDALSMETALQGIDRWIEHREPNFVCFATAHSILDTRNQTELLRQINDAGMVTPDGMVLVWLLKAKGWKRVTRVYGPDLMLEVCERSLRRGRRHFFYGGHPGVADILVERLTTRFPGIAIAGTYCPPFRPLTPEEDQDVIRKINESQADIVWVGLGAPKQERWMADHLGRLKAPVMIGVGAAFDFHSGRKRQAPRWMQRSGLEWFFRLVTDPLRTSRRVIRYPWFCILVLLQLMGLRRYPEIERRPKGR